MKQLLNTAIVIAANAHDGQYDKSGLPYMLHVMKVMHYLKSNDEELNCIAVLHDVIEDTRHLDEWGIVTANTLYASGMTERVVTAVEILSKYPGQKPGEYLE